MIVGTYEYYDDEPNVRRGNTYLMVSQNTKFCIPVSVAFYGELLSSETRKFNVIREQKTKAVIDWRTHSIQQLGRTDSKDTCVRCIRETSFRFKSSSVRALNVLINTCLYSSLILG